MAEKFKVGLALGSGGVRGMAHFGVIRTLMKYGIKISCVAGVSSGSVIGAALAAGKLDAFEDFFRRINWWKMFRMFFELSWPWNGGYLTGKRVKEECLWVMRVDGCGVRRPYSAPYHIYTHRGVPRSYFGR